MPRVARLAPLLMPCVLALGVVAPLPALAAKVYQWKDAQGVTHYTDLPPPGRHTARDVGGRPPASPAAKPVASANCTNARSNLKLLEGDVPVGIDADKDGKADAPMTAGQRAVQLQRAKVAVSVHCEASPISASAKTG